MWVVIFGWKNKGGNEGIGVNNGSRRRVQTANDQFGGRVILKEFKILSCGDVVAQTGGLGNEGGFVLLISGKGEDMPGVEGLVVCRGQGERCCLIFYIFIFLPESIEELVTLHLDR